MGRKASPQPPEAASKACAGRRRDDGISDANDVMIFCLRLPRFHPVTERNRNTYSLLQ
jgi:hypothetical protein